jgi:hypothetical protein
MEFMPLDFWLLIPTKFLALDGGDRKFTLAAKGIASSC